jgi:Protein of unknown function (DUF1569)
MTANTTLSGAAKQTQTVNTKKVTGRRSVRYNSYDEFLADAERLAAAKTRTLGNWSLGQIFLHLAKNLDMMIDGPPFLLPAPVRLFMWLFVKGKMLRETLSPGFNLPKKAEGFLPEPTTTEAGLHRLRAAVARVKGTAERGLHPGFGQMGPGEWDQFQLRHCELHMSFVVPATER